MILLGKLYDVLFLFIVLGVVTVLCLVPDFWVAWWVRVMSFIYLGYVLFKDFSDEMKSLFNFVIGGVYGTATAAGPADEPIKFPTVDGTAGDRGSTDQRHADESGDHERDCADSPGVRNARRASSGNSGG